ncbi:MAG: tRNA (N6-isopentenyl adenosine(37)-C2)-methylthiotransferase MiaB [Clostridiaceae bacterium]|nr:tRNA (N6-isopentenyl adenosine(37)-C2)-methylthiotransferase MiaB [Clostridiaceae bacterium]
MLSVDAGEMSRQQNYITQIGLYQAEYQRRNGVSRKYWIHTYGCQLNENDGEKIAGLLDEMGFNPAVESRDADLIVLNTCSIRENANDKLYGNLGMIKNLRRDRPDMIVAVCGCMMKQEEHVAKIRRSYGFVDLIFGPQDLHRLPELLYQRIFQNQKPYGVGREDSMAEGLPIHRARKFRALCSIMYGCNNFCTYCIVPYARGRERSRRPEDILAELRQLAAAGYREVMLLGQNVNSYGHDWTGTPVEDQAGADAKGSGRPYDFAALLADAARIGGLYRIRFMTSHPKDISSELLKTMSRYPVIEPHLHLPMQSGSNHILEQMNRHYTRERYLDIIREARSLIPDLALSTDIIVGFPGETEADFQDTLDLMEQVQFDSAFTFQYSKRAGTPAAAMAGQIPADVVSERFGRLTALQNSHSLASNQRWVGRSAEVLIEGRSGTADQILSGRTAQNHLVNFSVPDPSMLPASCRRPDGSIDGAAMEGSLAQVRLTLAKSFSLEGYLEAWHA